MGDKNALEGLATNILVDYQGEDGEINKMVVEYYQEQAENSEMSKYDLHLGLWSYYGKFCLEKNGAVVRFLSDVPLKEYYQENYKKMELILRL